MRTLMRLWHRIEKWLKWEIRVNFRKEVYRCSKCGYRLEPEIFDSRRVPHAICPRCGEGVILIQEDRK